MEGIKIYKIVNKDNVSYIGSSKQSLERVLKAKKREYEVREDVPVPDKSCMKVFEGQNEGDVEIVELECVPNDTNMLHELKERWMAKEGNCVNKTCNAGYYTCECGSFIRRASRKAHELSQQHNGTRKEIKDAVEYQKQYYADNKERLAKAKLEVVACECGSKYTKTSKARHVGTKKHMLFESENNIIE